MMLYNLERNATYFAKHIDLIISLGSFAYPEHLTFYNLLFFVYPFQLIDPLVKPFGLWQTLRHDSTFGEPLKMICVYSPSLCDIGIKVISDSNTDSHDQERKKVYMGHYPSGSSIRCW